QLSLTVARICLVLAPAGCVGIWWWRGFLRPWRLFYDERHAARLLGERIPELSLDLLAAVELQRALERTPGLSPELARAVLRETDTGAEAFDPDRAVDTRHVRMAAVTLSCVAGVVAALVLARPAGWWAGVSRAIWEAGVAARPAHRDPITGDVELVYRY